MRSALQVYEGLSPRDMDIFDGAQPADAWPGQYCED